MIFYHDLSQHYWWCGMKRYISDFVSRCLTCQQVKCKHQRPGGVSQRMPIPTWKWERITMDFVVGLPTTVGCYYSIWVVVDRLTKSAHFIRVRVKYTVEKVSRAIYQSDCSTIWNSYFYHIRSRFTIYF